MPKAVTKFAPSARTTGACNDQKRTDATERIMPAPYDAVERIKIFVQGRVTCCGVAAMVVAHPAAAIRCPRCGRVVTRT